MAQQGGTLPPAVPPNWGYAFYYGSLSWITAYFRVDVDTLSGYLAGTGFAPAVFADGMGAVGLNPMTYGSQLESLVEATTEAELNILAYPLDRASAVPTLSFHDFLMGDEQTKTVGNYRVWVPCDDPFAVAAGKGMFGENKFVTTMPYSIPGPNSPATAWTFMACDPPEDPDKNPPSHGVDPSKGCDPGKPGLYIFKMTAELSDASSVDGSGSPIIDYSVRAKNPTDPSDPGRPSGSYRNILGPLKTYLPASGSLAGVTVSAGSSAHPMTQAVRDLVEGRECVAAQTFMSANPVIESRPFWADEG
jgi:hypothetical protein